MSVQATTWVWEHSEVTGNARLILLAVADAANREGERSCQSIETICRMTRLSRATVTRHLADFRERGVLIKTGDGGPRYSYASVYQIAGMGGSQIETPSPEGGLTSDTGGVSKQTQGGLTGEPLPQEALPQEDYPIPGAAASGAGEVDLFGAEVKQRRSVQDIIRAWHDGYRSTHGGTDVDPALHGVIAGNAAKIAKSRTDSASWDRAIEAARRAGTSGYRDLLGALTGPSRPPAPPRPLSSGNIPDWASGSGWAMR